VEPADDAPAHAAAPSEVADDSGWENGTSEAWDAFASAYASGWEEGCQALFDQSPDGKLYYDDEPYDSSDCPSSIDPRINGDMPAGVPDDPTSEGDALGRAAGCIALFDNVLVPSLNWGTDSYTKTDCETI
jgi:hypothetical protein